jgi:hypothetical protein
LSVTVQVECYSGYTYAQEPRAFVWHARRYEVERVVKRWRTPAGPGFRVQGSGLGPGQEAQAQSPGKETGLQTTGVTPAAQLPMKGAQLFDLQYDEVEGQWTLEVYTSIQEDQR